MKKINLKKEIRNLKEKIYAKCLDCACYQPKEVINCEIQGCPLWEKRPVKTKGLYTLMKKLKEKNLSLYKAKK